MQTTPYMTTGKNVLLTRKENVDEMRNNKMPCLEKRIIKGKTCQCQSTTKIMPVMNARTKK